MSLINQLLGNQPFLIHLIVYASVNLLLFVIDVLTGPHVTWFQWPLLGWGLGLLAHGVLVYRTQRSRTA